MRPPNPDSSEALWTLKPIGPLVIENNLSPKQTVFANKIMTTVKERLAGRT